jgi:orotidine-5'-phosphate decarboxylase
MTGMVMQLMSCEIIVALDYANIEQARAMLQHLSPGQCKLKIGKQMFTLFGPDFVRECVELGFDVFLDLKFHDIPNTVANAITAACELGVWMMTVHVQGGVAMLQAARHAVDAFVGEKPKLVGVTVLTSLCDQDLCQLGMNDTVDQLVLRYADLAQQARLDGVVCSAHEAGLLRDQYNASMLLVTPGISLDNTTHTDQKRILTPLAAQQAGADYLVIGRAITHSQDPAKALQQCLQQLA